jgi:uncharacterized cupin superfamily protein
VTRRERLETLVAWLDATRRGDREALLALLAPDASWEAAEGRCATPQEIAGEWLRRAAELEDPGAIELAAGEDDGAVLRLRAPAGSIELAVAFAGDGRIASLTGRAADRGRGWFVVNVADAPWVGGVFGAYTGFEVQGRFPDVGFNLAVLEPGQPACFYHREADQEDFLVVRGEALLLVEGEERPLRTWDFFHCPSWTEHVIVGAGDGPCTLILVGGRTRRGVVYPVSELALRHEAGVRTETRSPREAYADTPDDEPVAFQADWLP